MKDTADNRREFKTCVQALFVTLGGEFTDAALFGYWVSLNDLELEQVRQACYHAMRTSKFVPKPSELRECILGKADDRALLAWGDVQRALPMGPYKHLDFSDRLINAVVRNLGGWPAFCSRFTDAESEKWVRIEFLKCYANLSSSGVNGEMCEPLPGLSEARANQGKLCAPEPLRIACSTNGSPRIRQTFNSALKGITHGNPCH